MDYGLMSDHETSKFFRETKQLRGEYEKFFAAVLDANSGGSAWEEVTLPGQFRRWKRADVAMSAKGVGLGNITLTTSELNRDRTKSGLDDHRKVLEGL